MAFIFDIDGTLIDSNDYHARAWEQAFAKFGIAVSWQEIRPHIGKGGDKLMPEFLSEEQMDKFGGKISEEREIIFKNKFAQQMRPFAKVRELFKAIIARDGRIALGSSAKKDEVREAMIVAQITDLVEQTTSSDDAEESKPEPDIFHSARRTLGDPPASSIIVVGDTPYDALAAVKAGLKPIGVLCGGFSEQQLRAAGCREIFCDPEAILLNVDKLFNP